MCEKFEKGLCNGCIGLQYDIDKLKIECEDYQKYMNKGKQIKLED